jgi:hypothetical protein
MGQLVYCYAAALAVSLFYYFFFVARGGDCTS